MKFPKSTAVSEDNNAWTTKVVGLRYHFLEGLNCDVILVNISGEVKRVMSHVQKIPERVYCQAILFGAMHLARADASYLADLPSVGLINVRHVS